MVLTVWLRPQSREPRSDAERGSPRENSGGTGEVKTPPPVQTHFSVFCAEHALISAGWSCISQRWTFELYLFPLNRQRPPEFTGRFMEGEAPAEPLICKRDGRSRRDRSTEENRGLSSVPPSWTGRQPEGASATGSFAAHAPLGPGRGGLKPHRQLPRERGTQAGRTSAYQVDAGDLLPSAPDRVDRRHVFTGRSVHE